MRTTDLSEVARLEKSLYAFPVEPRQLPRFGHRGLRLLGRHPRRGGDRLCGADGGARRGAPAQFRGRRANGRTRASAASSSSHMVEVARRAGCQIVYLEVRPSNLPARHLYRTLGFQQIAIRPEYYPALSGREDALFLGLVAVMDARVAAGSWNSSRWRGSTGSREARGVPLPRLPVAPPSRFRTDATGARLGRAARRRRRNAARCGLCRQRKQAVFGVGSQSGPVALRWRGPRRRGGRAGRAVRRAGRQVARQHARGDRLHARTRCRTSPTW